ncbi:stage II sporulation protein P [Paenibacillus selenitireducens]|uniref:Stage II sporulation protein P n=1 Tax=Paenibacillus selenitireducens TaxID=1324314 RepID=A0A1T2XEW8_9BACL|nr:stage II sporulation protein P [Paenibacillus selenitireducens]OPA78378.1 stage II sporulation protein P [Paenibacillus selenitireducens]
MKPTTFQTIHIPKMKQRMMQILVMGRTFAILTLCSMLFFIMLGLGTMLQKQWNTSPSTSMKGFAAAVSSHFFLDMLGMEVPHLSTSTEEPILSRQKLSSFLFQMLTNVNPSDPKSLLSHELPGLGRDDAVPLRTAIGNGAMTAPEDFNDSPAIQEPPLALPTPSVEIPLPGATQVPTKVPAKDIDAGKTTDGTKQAISGKKFVFIYHSHNRESWNPELSKKMKEPNSATKNITLVGQRLAEKLEQLGVGTLHSEEDYAATVKSYNWNYSYKYSRTTVKEAMTQNQDLQFFFDIHRDSQARKKTTVTINGKDYAQVYFIIGHGNKNWRENEAFANKIHAKLEKEYPGISRGIWGKSSANGNGEYNQSLSPNSFLIEIGGVDNTLQESYRTADILARLIADEVFQAEKVNAKATKK